MKQIFLMASIVLVTVSSYADCSDVKLAQKTCLEEILSRDSDLISINHKSVKLFITPMPGKTGNISECAYTYNVKYDSKSVTMVGEIVFNANSCKVISARGTPVYSVK